MPYDAVTDLLEKLRGLADRLLEREDLEVTRTVFDFLEGDLHAWMVSFQVNADMVQNVFERTWARRK